MPPDMRPLYLTDFDRFSIDEMGNLYWDNKRIITADSTAISPSTGDEGDPDE